MHQEQLDDYRWLVSPQAAPWFDRLDNSPSNLVGLARQLRVDLTADRTHLLLEQCDLRDRALAKFDAAPHMFFTRTGLEQATDQWIARYKAQRFPPGEPVADLCCGIGGDLFGLADRSDVTGVDWNPVRALLAETNCDALGLGPCAIESADATRMPLARFAAWHIDPDRRPGGHRTTRLAFTEPSVDALERMLADAPNGAIKLAPATHLPEHWCRGAEREWIGRGRECRQQMAWFGTLARHADRHTAVVVSQSGTAGSVLVGQPGTSFDVATGVRRFLYDPHAAVSAARLTGTLAEQYRLSGISSGMTYLTSDQLIRGELFATFAVIATWPFDRRRLRKALRQRKIGRLEVKKRGVSIDPESVRRQLRVKGDAAATLLITPFQGMVTAILAHRIS